MREYRFHDFNEVNSTDQDIQGDSYQRFLTVCFQYAESVSLYVNPVEVHLPSELFIDAYLPVTQSVSVVREMLGTLKAYSPKEGYIPYQLLHLKLTDEVKNFLRNRTGSLFQWLCGWGQCNPDDPAFFRKDGSVLFFSQIHEGECTLSPREDEDISVILSDSPWICIL